MVIIIVKNVIIEALDHFGRGVSHIDKKVVFVFNALPSEDVDILITLDKKKFMLANVIKYNTVSEKRKKSVCPYFNECGGCSLLNMCYDDTLEFKFNKVKELFKKSKLNFDFDYSCVIKNPHDLFYRNKVSLKIVKGDIGFYESKTHNLVKIDKCFLAMSPINEIIKNYKLLNLNEAKLTIRVSNNLEVLLIIESSDENKIDIDGLKKIVKLVGIVYNDKTIYKDNFLMVRLNNHLFKVSYNSFFQVNYDIASILFDLVLDNTLYDKVLDLYSGVGTLGLIASKKACEVLSVEIVRNAVLNGIFNAKINKRSNIKFLMNDAQEILGKVKKEFTSLIIDPPRTGLTKQAVTFVKELRPEKIIYISCDVNTLIRDLKLLWEEYKLSKFYILDMFSYTYHVECMCVLSIRN